MTRLAFYDERLEKMLMLNGQMPRASRVAFTDLENFSGRRIFELSREYWQNRETLDKQAQDYVAIASDEAAILAYYRGTTQYLYELSYVESSVKRQRWLKVLNHLFRLYSVKNALDVGGGIGSASLYFERRGIRCDYLDVPGRTYEYAAWRFRRHELNIRTFDATQHWPCGPYDAIIAWDVLEHLRDLDGKLSLLARCVRPGGLLVHWPTFTECEGVHLPENQTYIDVRRYDALLKKHGFSYRGQLKPSRLSRVMRL